MDKDTWALLMSNIEHIKSDVEELKKFRWAHAGFVIALSVVASISISLITLSTEWYKARSVFINKTHAMSQSKRARSALKR